jgi:xanthine dehydrogenase FAD-binding subunit
MFDIDSYHKADSVDEAIARLVQNPKAIPLAGGTDILVRLHQGNPDYRHVVDIHHVAELKKISLEPDGTLVVGSGATFTDLTESRIITENIPVLAQGADSVGGPQVRNQATVGGNIGKIHDGRNLVIQHVVVINSTGVRINHERFEQRSPDAHGHAAMNLSFSG